MWPFRKKKEEPSADEQIIILKATINQLEEKIKLLKGKQILNIGNNPPATLPSSVNLKL